MNVAELVLVLKANTSEFTKEMQTMVKKTKSSVETMQKDLAKINKSTKDMGDNWKDVSRIVQGIAVSKALYSTLNAIQDVSTAVWDFKSNLEYAQMVYKNLFGDATLATEFLNVISDVAAVSPFNFTDIESATKRLKAYGIETQNLMYVTQGVLAAASGQGNSNAIEPISRALGEIYTKGVLKAEEVRQLAEAGIPVYKILQEQLGLTQEQLGNIGDQAIPASTAINALVDGINLRFNGILKDSAETLPGLVSNIHDNFLMLGAEAIDPIYQKVRSFLAELNGGLTQLKQIASTEGIGGVFEALVPEELQESVRTFIGNLMVLHRNLTIS